MIDVYFKEDEDLHKEFEKDNAIIEVQSNGQDAQLEDFKSYIYGYNQGIRKVIKALEREKHIQEHTDSGEAYKFTKWFIEYVKSGKMRKDDLLQEK